MGSGQGPVLVLGLGNPGEKYHGSRHNIGFAVIDEICRRYGLALNKSNKRSLWAKARVVGTALVIAKPQTYMNLSGEAALALLNYFDLEPDRLIVVHDDLDLPFGRVKVAVKGGDGGHKGVRSIKKLVGTDRFARVKVGIGRPRHGENIEDYVLAGFYADQRSEVGNTVAAAADCLEVVIASGVDAAMQQFHRKLKEEEEG